jgi:hypothetical protein
LSILAVEGGRRRSAREAEVDLNGPDWEDLDAENANDPMMVSKYVIEIYLKGVEVCFSRFPSTQIC